MAFKIYNPLFNSLSLNADTYLWVETWLGGGVGEILLERVEIVAVMQWLVECYDIKMVKLPRAPFIGATTWS